MAADERQPLLPPTALVSDADLHERAHPHDEETVSAQQVEGEEVDPELVKEEEVKKPRSWAQFAWRAVLVALGVFFTVLFIKGFIDADDVDVGSILYETHSR